MTQAVKHDGKSARISATLLPFTHKEKIVRSCTLHPNPGHSALNPGGKEKRFGC